MLEAEHLQKRTIKRHLRSEEVHGRMRDSVASPLTYVLCKRNLKPNSKLCILWETLKTIGFLRIHLSPIVLQCCLVFRDIFSLKIQQNHLQTGAGRIRNMQYHECGGYAGLAGVFCVPAGFSYWAGNKSRNLRVAPGCSRKRNLQKPLTPPFAMIMWGSQHQFWKLLGFLFPKNNLPGHF